MPPFEQPDIEQLKTQGDVLGLRKALRDAEYEHLGVAAADALGQIADPRAVEPLVAALASGKGRARGAAARALAQIGEASAVGPLAAALRDENWSVCQDVAKALEKLGWTPDRGEAGAAFWAARGKWQKIVEIGPASVEFLIACLGNRDTSLRTAAADALGRIGDARAVEPLVVRLKYDEEVRLAAADALGRIGDPRAVAPLTGALHDPDLGVCFTAAGALVRIGAPAVEPLIAAFGNQAADTNVRKAAAQALGQIGDARAVGALIAVLGDQVADKNVRVAAAEALGQIADARAADPLMAALACSNREVRRGAAEGLVAMYRSGKLGPEDRGRVLAERGVITQAHSDEVWGSCSFARHDDSGIGVDFPL